MITFGSQVRAVNRKSGEEITGTVTSRWTCTHAPYINPIRKRDIFFIVEKENGVRIKVEYSNWRINDISNLLMPARKSRRPVCRSSA